jgi:hypothetical protein
MGVDDIVVQRGIVQYLYIMGGVWKMTPKRFTFMYNIGPNSCECKKAKFCYTSLNVPNVFQPSGADALYFAIKSAQNIEGNDKVV